VSVLERTGRGSRGLRVGIAERGCLRNAHVAARQHLASEDE
jgi:hypothetical protein